MCIEYARACTCKKLVEGNSFAYMYRCTFIPSKVHRVLLRSSRKCNAGDLGRDWRNGAELNRSIIAASVGGFGNIARESFCFDDYSEK